MPKRQTKMTIENLVDIQAPLVEAFRKLVEEFRQLDPNTIRHSYEIMNARRSDESLRNIWFWTADSALYRTEKQPVLYFGNRDTNLIFKNIDEATQQLINSMNYIPKQKDIESVINSGSVLRIKLSDLKLKDQNNELSSFEIDTKEYNKLNEVQRAFAEGVYGQKDDFKANMKMLNDAGIKTTRIYVLNPVYVSANAKENSAIVRTCGLDIFGYVSRFYASSWGFGYSYDSVRVVLYMKKSPEAHAPKN